MKKRILSLIIIAIFLALAFFFFSKKGNKVEAISTTGIVEGAEVNLSAKVSGRISEFCCKEGNKVSAGSLVVKLESDDIKASVEQARAGVLKAKADMKSAEASVKNSEANIRSAEADAKKAEAEMERARVLMQEAEKEMHRSEYLYKNELISNREADTTMASYESSIAALSASEAASKAAISRKEASVSQVDLSYGLLNSARARLKEAEAALKLQEARLRDTEIVSPISGTVVFKGMEAGEVVSPGATVVTIVDMEDLWVRADIEETMIGRVRVGDEAVISIDGMPGASFKGTVAEIGREADFATLKDVTRGRQDIKTFRVKVKIEDKTGALKPGMTVKVKLVGKG